MNRSETKRAAALTAARYIQHADRVLYSAALGLFLDADGRPIILDLETLEVVLIVRKLAADQELSLPSNPPEPEPAGQS